MHLNYATAPTMTAALHWLLTHDDDEGAGHDTSSADPSDAGQDHEVVDGDGDR
jgi:hypothetical protein